MTNESRISRSQREFILKLLDARPERVEVLNLVMGEKGEAEMKSDFARRFIAIRQEKLYAISNGNKLAIEKARAEHALASIPHLYDLLRGARSHTMSYVEASCFIEWLLADLTNQRNWLLHYPSPLTY